MSRQIAQDIWPLCLPVVNKGGQSRDGPDQICNFISSMMEDSEYTYLSPNVTPKSYRLEFEIIGEGEKKLVTLDCAQRSMDMPKL